MAHASRLPNIVALSFAVPRFVLIEVALLAELVLLSFHALPVRQCCALMVLAEPLLQGALAAPSLYVWLPMGINAGMAAASPRFWIVLFRLQSQLVFPFLERSSLRQSVQQASCVPMGCVHLPQKIAI